MSLLLRLRSDPDPGKNLLDPLAKSVSKINNGMDPHLKRLIWVFPIKKSGSRRRPDHRDNVNPDPTFEKNVELGHYI